MSTTDAIIGFATPPSTSLLGQHETRIEALEALSGASSFTATGDGVTDDTAAFQAAIAAAISSGTRRLEVPHGNYLVTGLSIPADSTSIDAQGFELIGIGRPTITLSAADNRVALDLLKRRFITVQGFVFTSTGTKSDGHSTIGLRLPDDGTTTGNSRIVVRDCKFENFSYAGLQAVQCLDVSLENLDVLNCGYGISLEPDNTSDVPTTVNIRTAYVSNCKRGIYGYRLVAGTWSGVILEGCGSSSTTDGALHLDTATRGLVIVQPYFESNNRNYVLTDARCVLIYPLSIDTPAGADSITWSGVATVDRGQTQILQDGILTSEINPDPNSGRSLSIGPYISLPNAGTTPTISGAASITATILKSDTTQIAASGFLRMGNKSVDATQFIGFRNQANSATLPLDVNASDRLEFNSVNVHTEATAAPAVLGFYASAAAAATTNAFLRPWFFTSAADTTELTVVLPFACKLSSLYVFFGTGATGGTTTVTVRKNGVDTAITATLAAAATTGNDTTHTQTFAAGDRVSVKIVSNTGVSVVAAQVQVSLQCTVA